LTFKRPFGFKTARKLCKEYQYEYVEFDNIPRWKFVIRFWLGWFFNKQCEECGGDGMTGYYERESCSNCGGFGIQIKGIYYEPSWKNFDPEKWVSEINE
jgi:hypothetical protein